MTPLIKSNFISIAIPIFSPYSASMTSLFLQIIKQSYIIYKIKNPNAVSMTFMY